MAIIRYTKQDEYDLANSGQECIGWSVVDQAGNRIGTVTELLIDTEREMVDSILVDQDLRIPAADFAMKDQMVVVRGIAEGGAGNRTATSENRSANELENYAAVQRAANARHVAGITREADDNEVTVPVIEEELRVGKREVERGGVRVHTRVTEQPVQENVHLREERVSVERRPVDRPIGSGDMEAFQEGTVEVTEMGEEAVVEKRARVAEEVVVRKDVEERDETIRDTVRRSDVEVEQTGGQMRGGSMSGDMSGMTDRSGVYRGHYQTNFANSGYQYEHFEPAYMYGSQLHDYEGYQGWEWDRVEPEARQAWEQRNPGTWERIRDAVRYGFDNMRENVRGEGTSSRNRNRG